MYLEIDEGFIGHRKTMRLCGLMQDPNAFAYLLRLWTWAVRSAPDGRLTGMEPLDLEIAAGYRHLDGKLYAALVRSGFIDERDGAPVELHGWMKRTGLAIRRMADGAERKRIARNHAANHKTKADPTCELCKSRAGKSAGAGLSEDEDATVPGQSADCPRTRTVSSEDCQAPDQTRPDQSRPDQSSPVQTSQGQGFAPEAELSPAGAGAVVALTLIPPPAASESRKAEDVRAVFAHYRTKHPRAFPKPRPDSSEWRAISKQFDGGYTVADLCRAIDGYHLSPFHCGENDRGQKYLDLGLIVRTGDHVRRGIEYAEHAARGSPVMNERERRGVRAGMSWLERSRANGGSDG